MLTAPASWDNALDVAADRFAAIIREEALDRLGPVQWPVIDNKGSERLYTEHRLIRFGLATWHARREPVASG